MGTLLKRAGALVFLATLFLPTLNGCGRRLSEAGLVVDDPSFGGAIVLLGALAFDLLALLGGATPEKPRPFLDAWVALLAAAFSAGAVFFFAVARGKGARLLGPAQVQVVALITIFLGSLLRLRNSRPRR